MTGADAEQAVAEQLTLEEFLTFAFSDIDSLTETALANVGAPDWDTPLVEGRWTPYEWGDEWGDHEYDYWEPTVDPLFSVTWHGTWTYSPTDPVAQLELCRSVGNSLKWLRTDFPDMNLDVGLPADDHVALDTWRDHAFTDSVMVQMWNETFSLRGVRLGVEELRNQGWRIENHSEPGEDAPLIGVTWGYTVEVVGHDVAHGMHDADVLVRVPIGDALLQQILARTSGGESMDDVVAELTGTPVVHVVHGDQMARQRQLRQFITESFRTRPRRTSPDATGTD